MFYFSRSRIIFTAISGAKSNDTILETIAGLRSDLKGICETLAILVGQLDTTFRAAAPTPPSEDVAVVAPPTKQTPLPRDSDGSDVVPRAPSGFDPLSPPKPISLTTPTSVVTSGTPAYTEEQIRAYYLAAQQQQQQQQHQHQHQQQQQQVTQQTIPQYTQEQALRYYQQTQQ